MFKKFATITVALFIAVFVLSGCSSSGKDATPTAAPKASAKQTLPEPPTQKPVNHTSFAGDWTAKGSDDNGGMAATIDDTGIVINWTGKDVSALYWKGTFPMSAEDGTVTSKGDVEAMKDSLMAESINPESKKFTIKDGKIIFTVTALGVTKTVTLEKD